MKNYYILCFLLMLCFTWKVKAENSSTISFQERTGEKIWTLESDVVKFEVKHTSTGAVLPNSFYNKESEIEYLRVGGSHLFNLIGRFIPTVKSEDWNTSKPFTFKSSDAEWQYKEHSIDDIKLSSALNTILIGKRLSVIFEKDDIRLNLVFEIFNGRSGLRYQAFVKNKRKDAKMIIEKSDVISLNIQNKPHSLHYVTNINWLSATSSVEEAPMNNKGKNVAKCLLNLYDTNDGWYMAPEVNWKTQYGPEIPEDGGYEYMHRSFAGATAWSGGSSFIKVSTCPESFQLVLFPKEEFEYIAVNMTTFKGDIVDAKMAVEEHLRKRFRYHNTSTTFVVNDWDWFTQGLRNENFYKEVVIPQTKKAGYEMIMFDDGWNNPNSNGTGLNNEGLSRDPVEVSPIITQNMKSFTQHIVDHGLLFGLWYSNSGGNHNRGNDLANPEIIQAKKDKIEYMINNYHMSHQAADLTQYWQNVEETRYSHPSDNVYRKNVLTRNMMNELVDKYPQYVVKVTSELDIYPTQGDRNVDLIHLPNNGWITITGANAAIEAPALLFGHYPLSAAYVGGGNPTGKMVDHYASMSSRNIKVSLRPDQWDETGIKIMGEFNKWRKSHWIKELTDGIMRPVYFGEKWDSRVASEWNIGKGPYLWMHVNEAKSKALLVGTTSGRDLGIGKKYPIRWLDESKTYLIQDITLDDTGIFTYNFIGKFSGSELKSDGLGIEFYQNTSGAKAFWIQEFVDAEKQVIYADSGVKSYSENLNTGQLKVTAIGEPNSVGKIVVYGKAENDAMTVNISFDQNGNGEALIDAIINNNIPYPGHGSEIVYQMKDYHIGMEKSDESIYVTEVDNGLGNGDKSSYIRMNALNDYVIYKLQVPFSGECKVQANYKVSKSSRGVAQLYTNDSDENEKLLGPAFDQSTTGAEEMKTINLGVIQMQAPDIVGIKMKLVGYGVSGTGSVLTLNQIIIRKNE